jgi:hypothetical protein
LFIFDWQVGFTNVYLDNRNHTTFLRALLMQYGVGLWCLTLFSVIFQLYRGGHFVFWCRKPLICRKSLYHIMMCRVHHGSARFELMILVVIGTDCICSCKANNHTITTTTALDAIQTMYIFKLVCTTRFLNNLHRVHSRSNHWSNQCLKMFWEKETKGPK